MEKSFESRIDCDKLNKIHTSALWDEGFGDTLENLSLEELEVLMGINEEFYLQNIVEWKPGKIGILINSIRKELTGKNYDSVPKHIRIIQKLQKEILAAIGKYLHADPETAKLEEYKVKFLMFLESLNDEQTGPNATTQKVRLFVKAGHEQVTPDIDPDNKVVISIHKSNEENLAFIQKHMNTAIERNNIK